LSLCGCRHLACPEIVGIPSDALQCFAMIVREPIYLFKRSFIHVEYLPTMTIG